MKTTLLVIVGLGLYFNGLAEDYKKQRLATHRARESLRKVRTLVNAELECIRSCTLIEGAVKMALIKEHAGVLRDINTLMNDDLSQPDQMARAGATADRAIAISNNFQKAIS